MGARLMAIVAEGDHGRVYLSPTAEHEERANEARPEWQPDARLEGKSRQSVSNYGNYGIDTVGDLFTPRQLLALNTFCDLVTEARDRIRQDAVTAGLPDDERPLHAGGAGATAYADGVGIYLEFAQSKAANRNTSLCLWEHRMDRLVATFGRQALPMIWDFAETNPLAGRAGRYTRSVLHGRHETGAEAAVSPNPPAFPTTIYYALCERKKRADEALDYNGLVQSWPEIARLAVTEARERQSALFGGGDGAGGDGTG